MYTGQCFHYAYGITEKTVYNFCTGTEITLPLGVIEYFCYILLIICVVLAGHLIYLIFTNS